MPELTASYWDDRYQNENTGWDIGYPSPAITSWFDKVNERELEILFPGGGNGYEVEYLYRQGFQHVYLLDWSPLALQNFHRRFPDFPKDQLLQGDFFEHTRHYDIIVEQTFFCAIDPTLRAKYVEKMHQLLKPGGRLVGLLFNDPLNTDHPPYGGNKDEYLKLFSPYFDIHHLETAQNSIEPRAGRELFVEMVKKSMVQGG